MYCLSQIFGIVFRNIPKLGYSMLDRRSGYGGCMGIDYATKWATMAMSPTTMQ